MEYSCEFCNSKFKSKYNLNTHIKSAKFCINNRDQNNNINNYPCKYCNKTFTVKNKFLQSVAAIYYYSTNSIFL